MYMIESKGVEYLKCVVNTCIYWNEDVTNRLIIDITDYQRANNRRALSAIPLYELDHAQLISLTSEDRKSKEK